MAFEWTRHACTLGSSDLMGFGTRFTSELVRVLQAYPGEQNADVARRAFDLHRRHGQTVVRVLETMIAKHAPMLARHHLSDTSLLALHLGVPLTSVPAEPDPLTLDDLRIAPAPRSGYGAAAPPPLFPLRVAFFEMNDAPAIEVDGLGCVRHGPAAVAHDLKPQYEDDITEGLAPENHRFVPLATLSASGRHVAPNTVAQMVKRCRDELAEFYAAIEQRKPDRPLLIENRRNKGYRLDPTLRAIRRDQLRNGAT